MFNNYSYRQFSVTGGPTFFNFSASRFYRPNATCYPGVGSYGRDSTIRLSLIRVTMASSSSATK